MTTPEDTMRPIPHRPRDLDLQDRRWARAYCGPAHGHTWRRDEFGNTLYMPMTDATPPRWGRTS